MQPSICFIYVTLGKPKCRCILEKTGCEGMGTDSAALEYGAVSGF
jgi:hypothetical protein